MRQARPPGKDNDLRHSPAANGPALDGRGGGKPPREHWHPRCSFGDFVETTVARKRCSVANTTRPRVATLPRIGQAAAGLTFHSTNKQMLKRDVADGDLARIGQAAAGLTFHSTNKQMLKRDVADGDLARMT
ncbi:Uncharacterized protein FWK35_00026764, partial [Aphis craccivora]